MIDSTWYQKPEGVEESISAGGVIARRERGRVMVALVREEGVSHYILPKGKAEPGEPLEQAARREIAEEAGLTDLELVGELGVQERWNYNKKAWKKITYYLYRTDQVECSPTDPTHLYRCEWFQVDELPEMFWPDQRQLIEENREKIISLM